MAVIKEIATVASVSMPIGESWTVKRCRYRSEEDAGKRMCITTGTHGDEKMGQLIVYEVAQRIMQESSCLHGIVDLYPMLNPMGLDLDERMVPTARQLDMNRAFPGAEDGTAMENICWNILEDMKDADFVLDIHTSAPLIQEMYSARVHEKMADRMIPEAKALCPELIWVLPDKPSFNASLSGALTQCGTPAVVLEVNGHRSDVTVEAKRVVDGIFCKMRELGLWSGQTVEVAEDVPCVRSAEDISYVTCTKPGMYVPVDRIGMHVQAGEVLGRVVDALVGETMETLVAPQAGQVFVQRRYSAVYPGTTIVRLCRKEHA